MPGSIFTILLIGGIVVLVGVYRESEVEGAAFGLDAFDGDLAAVCLDEVLADK